MEENNLILFEAKIYTLIGKDKKVFYVGCTIGEVEKRLCEHITEAKKFEGWDKMPLRSYAIIINEFDVSATIVDVIEIYAIDGKDAKFKAEPFETRWIRKYLDDGVDLVNARNIRKKINKQFIGKTVKAA